MNNVKAIQDMNEKELSMGIDGRSRNSWHSQHSDSACVFVGGLEFNMSEGDLLVVMSQFGEIVDVRLVRDRETGKSKGFAYVTYEDQRSTILAVDNMNGVKLLGRILRVDHAEYKPILKNSDSESSDEDFTSFKKREQRERRDRLLLAEKEYRKDKRTEKKHKKELLYEARKARLTTLTDKKSIKDETSSIKTEGDIKHELLEVKTEPGLDRDRRHQTRRDRPREGRSRRRDSS